MRKCLFLCARAHDDGETKNIRCGGCNDDEANQIQNNAKKNRHPNVYQSVLRHHASELCWGLWWPDVERQHVVGEGERLNKRTREQQ